MASRRLWLYPAWLLIFLTITAETSSQQYVTETTTLVDVEGLSSPANSAEPRTETPLQDETSDTDSSQSDVVNVSVSDKVDVLPSSVYSDEAVTSDGDNTSERQASVQANSTTSNNNGVSGEEKGDAVSYIVSDYVPYHNYSADENSDALTDRSTLAPPSVAESTSLDEHSSSTSKTSSNILSLPPDLPSLQQWRQRVQISKCCIWSEALHRRSNSTSLSCKKMKSRSRWRPLVFSSTKRQWISPGDFTSVVPVTDRDINDTCNDSGDPLWLDSSVETDRFVLLTTGHLYLVRSDALLPPSSFCVDQLVTENTASASSRPHIAARVCLPSLHNRQSLLDPLLLRPTCVRGLCLRKCCPRGLKVQRDSQLCIPQTGPQAWSPTFHAQSEPVKDLRFTTVSGNPVCKLANGSGGAVFPLEPAYYDIDKFFLQTDGRLWVPAQDITIELANFCIDQVEYNYQGRVVDYHFAIVCYGEPVRTASVYVYRALLAVSGVFLLLTLLAYALVPELQNLHGKCLLSHVSALLAAYICLIVAQMESVYNSGAACRVIALVMYFSFIAACFWLNAMSFDIWLTFSRMRTAVPGGSHLRRFLRYSGYCWCSALTLTVLVAVMQYAPDHSLPPEQVIRPQLGDKSCWFPPGSMPLLVYFHVPILVLMLANLVLFILTARNLLKAERDTRMAARKKKSTERLKIYVNLFIVMGITWIAEALSLYLGPVEIWFITDIINALQGFFIFLLFTMREATRRTIARRLAGWKLCRRCGCCTGPLQQMAAAGAASLKTNSTSDSQHGSRHNSAPRRAAPAATANSAL